MALIEDAIPLPTLLHLRSKSYLRFGIPQNENGHKRPGQIPFGFVYADYQLVKGKAEQEVIRMIRQHRAGGLSLRQIAGRLNQRLVPTKNGGIWQANTVRKILARA